MGNIFKSSSVLYSLSSNLTVLEENNQTIPNSTNLKDIDITKATFKDAGECFVTLVDIDFDFNDYWKESNKTVRRNTTLPYWLNERAKQANINVSEVLKEALIKKLQED